MAVALRIIIAQRFTLESHASYGWLVTSVIEFVVAVYCGIHRAWVVKRPFTKQIW